MKKKIASQIYQFLFNKKKYFIKNKLSLTIVKKNIFKLGAHKIDYIKILDINKLVKPYKKKQKV